MVRLSLLVGMALLVVALYSPCTHAQDSMSTKPHFALSGSLGWTLGATWKWFHLQTSDMPYRYRIAPAGNVGAVYGPLSLIQQTNIYLSLEAGYSKVQTEDAPVEIGTAHAEFELIPILAWAELSTESLVSPFVGVGVGAGRVHVRETYTKLEYANTDITYWGLAWVFRFGLDWKPSRNVRLALSRDNINVEGTHLEMSLDGNRRGIRVRTGAAQYGIRFEYSL